MPTGDEDATASTARTPRREQRCILTIVEDQQAWRRRGPGFTHETYLIRQLQLTPITYLHEAYAATSCHLRLKLRWVSAGEPEDTPGEIFAVAISEFYGELRLADAADSADYHRRCLIHSSGFFTFEQRSKRTQIAFPPNEKWVASELAHPRAGWQHSLWFRYYVSRQTTKALHGLGWFFRICSDSVFPR